MQLMLAIAAPDNSCSPVKFTRLTKGIRANEVLDGLSEAFIQLHVIVAVTRKRIFLTPSISRLDFFGIERLMPSLAIGLCWLPLRLCEYISSRDISR